MRAKNRAKKLEVVTEDSGDFLTQMIPRTVTEDGWSNSTTGMGFLGRDKGEATTFRGRAPLSPQEYDDLGRGDGFACIIVDSIVDDAMKAGWVVNFVGDEDNEVSPEESHELNERLQRKYKDTKLKARVSQHLKQARQYGGSLLALGVTDGQHPSKPLDLERVTGFGWMRAHDRQEVTQSAQVNDDASSVGFGFPQAYTLHSTYTQSGNGEENLIDTWIDSSRVWRTDGVVLSERVRQQNSGWGDSVLEVCREQLSNRGSVMKSARTVIQEWVMGVYKIKNLAGIISATGENKVRSRFSIMDRLKSIWQGIIVDAENEDYQRLATTAAGMSEVLDRFGMDLAAVAKMPMTKLFGLSPGGFGTGEAEGDNWDDEVKSYQTDTVEPLLEYVHKLLFATPEFADFPENWSIKFNSLQLTSPLEDADVRLKTAQKDALEISSGVVGADEVAMSRYGGSTYSTETTLDVESRQMDAELEIGPITPDESGISVIGENLADVLGVLKDVTAGAMTEKAAELVLSLSYPTVEASEFRRLVKEAAKADPPPPASPFAPRGAPPFAAPKPDEASGESAESDDDETPDGSSEDSVL